ncbi:MAG: AI-2E family transporter [Candidatus Pacearchaeota archaeon]
MPRKSYINNPADHYTSRKTFAVVILIGLLILAFFLIKPFIVAVIFGLVLAFILAPLYKQILKLVKNPTAASLIITIVTVLVLAVALYFIAQITIKEAFNLYIEIQKIDFYTLINGFLSRIFETPDLSRQITTTIQQAIITLTSSFTENVGKVLTDAPTIILQLFVVFFVAYYSLKEGPKITNYIKEILPFTSEVNERLIKRSKEISSATIYGQVVVGIIQGAVAGVGFYIFGAPSPLFFTLLAILLSIIPFIGPAFVWVPVSIVMIAMGNTTNGILMFIFGVLVVSWIDNIIKPGIVGKKGKINEVVALIGMLGGLALIGPVGIIVGPLVLEYLLIFIELYRTGTIKLAS